MNIESLERRPEEVGCRPSDAENVDAWLADHDVKIRINTLLWELLPEAATLGEAETLACQWYGNVQVAHEKAAASKVVADD